MKTTLRELLLMVPGHIDILLSDSGCAVGCEVRGMVSELMYYLNEEVLSADVLDIYPKFEEKVLWIIINMGEDESDDEL